ncbi:hypothetical protein NX862_03400 [Rhodobacter sp. KR11]|nr:hypothetical protein [Rhodobacter sp. KR11]
MRVRHPGRANGKTGDNCHRSTVSAHGIDRKHNICTHGKRSNALTLDRL